MLDDGRITLFNETQTDIALPEEHLVRLYREIPESRRNPGCPSRGRPCDLVAITRVRRSGRLRQRRLYPGLDGQPLGAAGSVRELQARGGFGIEIRRKDRN